MTTDPLANTPAHTVLMHPAFGDHQVTRSGRGRGAHDRRARRTNPLDPGRSYDVQPFYAIPRIASLGSGGSVLEIWDNQITPPAPTTTRPTARGPTRTARRARRRRRSCRSPSTCGSAGLWIDTCSGGPCHSLP